MAQGGGQPGARAGERRTTRCDAARLAMVRTRPRRVAPTPPLPSPCSNTPVQPQMRRQSPLAGRAGPARCRMTSRVQSVNTGEAHYGWPADRSVSVSIVCAAHACCFWCRLRVRVPVHDNVNDIRHTVAESDSDAPLRFQCASNHRHALYSFREGRPLGGACARMGNSLKYCVCGCVLGR